MTLKEIRKVVRSRAPLRIGLAGGGTDIFDFYSLHGGAVLNTTINKYAYAEVIPCSEGFTATALDFGIEKRLDINDESDSVPKQVMLHSATYKRIMTQFNDGHNIPCKLNTYCDAPIGSGLGSSSTLVVAMVKAFAEALNLGLDDYQLAELAYEIERKDCGLAGGRQDQFAATFGGFNFIEFERERTIVNPLRIKNWFKCELESSLILHFMGVSRSSAAVISDQIKTSHKEDGAKLEPLFRLKEESIYMKEAVLKCNRGGIAESLKRSWENKAKTSKKVSSPIIEERILFAVGHGAEAAKVSGAGGGGFILFMCQPSAGIHLRQQLLSTGGETMFCSFCDHGVQAWTM